MPSSPASGQPSKTALPQCRACASPVVPIPAGDAVSTPVAGSDSLQRLGPETNARRAGMQIVHEFPRPVREIENVFIELADGCRLAARIWLPADAEADPVPAILEYLPYRKRDGTSQRDALTHPYFAGHGYACVRVDMRGNGESDGLMLDEYTQQEQDDALEVIDWLARQPWCTGAVGMIGISWGGFNGLQVAARRPPALKAVISLVLDRRSLRRRHPLHGRLPAQRQPELGLDHVRLLLAPAGSGAPRRALARAVAAPPRAHRAPGRGMAAPPAPRPAMAARLGVREFRGDPVPGLRGRRLGGRLFQCDPAPARGPTRAEEGPDRPVGAPLSRISPRPARRSASSRSACAGGTTG